MNWKKRNGRTVQFLLSAPKIHKSLPLAATIRTYNPFHKLFDLSFIRLVQK